MQSPYKYSFRVTSIQGMRTLNGITRPHNGLDLVGTDKHIYAVKGGTVVVSSMITDRNNDAWGFGNRVAIKDTDGNFVMYNHLAERLVQRGQVVKAGDLIGIEGCSGDVYPKGTGVHLHIEVRDKQGVGFKVFSAADYIGIPNAIGVHVPPMTKPDYARLVAEKCGLEQQTIDYLNRYKFAEDLWYKLAEHMK